MRLLGRSGQCQRVAADVIDVHGCDPAGASEEGIGAWRHEGSGDMPYPCAEQCAERGLLVLDVLHVAKAHHRTILREPLQ